MLKVKICITQYMNPVPPYTWRVTCESSVSSWLGTGCSRWARTEMPRKSAPRMEAIHTSVLLAFFEAGSLKAPTPFEMASMPDSATAPDAKPRKR
ncbi:unannotated protein [freshwater metagenome]|uniref:Unannotated protein n=1 Tax=freshwater metagenome TaxID=449393 RepID=A0A6J7H392_9ZZZZ